MEEKEREGEVKPRRHRKNPFLKSLLIAKSRRIVPPFHIPSHSAAGGEKEKRGRFDRQIPCRSSCASVGEKRLRYGPRVFLLNIHSTKKKRKPSDTEERKKKAKEKKHTEPNL